MAAVELLILFDEPWLRLDSREERIFLAESPNMNNSCPFCNFIQILLSALLFNWKACLHSHVGYIYFIGTFYSR